ncbi:MAG: ABC transporter permease [Nitrososphaerales archaeon]|nr:ABC transporter permease [Nitrososphaerales archaeon]
MTAPKPGERGKRGREFWNLYRRSKFGILGLTLLALFLFTALSAPLLTPYDPYSSVGISSAEASPSWFTFFDSKLAPDSILIHDPQLSTPQAFQSFRFSATVNGGTLALAPLPTTSTADAWSVRNGTYELGRISIAYSPTQTGGSLNILFNKTSNFDGVVQLSVVRPVNYSYSPPPRFRVNFNLTMTKTAATGYRVAVSILSTNGTEYRLWDAVNAYATVATGGGGILTKNLSTSMYSLDSYLIDPYTKTTWFHDSTSNAAKKIFSAEGAYGVESAFVFSPGASGPETAQFSLSNLQVKVDGDASGWLGTDELGRDIFTQLVYGTRWALYVGILAASLGVALGLTVGLIAGYSGGVIEEFLMRIADFILVLPFLPFLIVLSVLLRPSVTTITWIIAILGWPTIARLIRSIVVSLKARAFVEAAKASGSGTRHILLRHMLPNVSPVAFTQLVLFIPGAIITLTAITFLGLGDATIVDWGYMTNAAFTHNFRAWWWILPPGILTAILSSSFLFVGYAMDSILNPRLRKR